MLNKEGFINLKGGRKTKKLPSAAFSPVLIKRLFRPDFINSKEGNGNLASMRHWPVGRLYSREAGEEECADLPCRICRSNPEG